MQEYIDLIRKVTWSFVRRHPGLEFDDLFSEACVICLEALKEYDPSQGEKSTFIWVVTQNHIKFLISRDVQKNDTEELWADPPEIEYAFTPESPEAAIIAQERYDELHSTLSAEARHICELLVDGDEYMPTDKPKKCRGQLIQTLRNAGWTWDRIWDGFSEVKRAVQ